MTGAVLEGARKPVENEYSWLFCEPSEGKVQTNPSSKPKSEIYLWILSHGQGSFDESPKDSSSGVRGVVLGDELLSLHSWS